MKIFFDGLKFISRIITIYFILTKTSLSFASPISCKNLFIENNTNLAAFYKTDVSFVKNNAFAFYEEIKERFNNQKKEGKNPYSFPFEESRGVLKYMKAEIQVRILKYETEGLYWRPTEKQNAKQYKILGQTDNIINQRNKLITELEFLKSVQSDLIALDQLPELPYDELLYRAYDFLLVMQGTQIENEAYLRTFIYEFYHVTKVENIEVLFSQYKSGTLERYGKSKYNFAVTSSQIFDPNELRLVIVPVVGFLLASDLIANRNVPVHFATVSGETVKADGFVQDPLTLFLHDIKFHAGKRESNDLKYFKERNMTDTEILEFRRLQKIWIQDFIESTRKIPDKKMRTAIFQAAQTVSHDRGKIFAPSTFNDHQWRNYYFVMKGEIYVSAWGQPNRGIGQNLSEILPYMNQAFDWVNKFWLKYKNSPY